VKVTNYGPDGLPVTLAGWSTGITSLNSNVNTTDGGYSALNFVQAVTANGSNFLMRPIVNFAAGSNTTITVDQGPLASFPSNTIRIHSTGGGSVSAGSNSTRVSEVPTAGASTTLWSPYDHAHDGIGTITASSSNTMQRGTWNIRPGAGIALSLTDTDGDGEFDTATIVNTGVPGPAGSGIASGTSFPGSPASNDIYYRTDRDILYFYDGTRWMTVSEYTLPMFDVILQNGIAANTEIARGGFDGTYDAYVTSVEFDSQVITTNDGSKFWTLKVSKYTPTSVETSLASQATSGDTVNNWVYHTVAVNAVVDRTTHTMVNFQVAKTSTPGNIYAHATIKYRLVG